jgi:alkylation response protein AidB-like acyl-CoA dehydrogenase
MLIARTAPDQPKHQGITYFAVDMHQPGVEVRPLREMTGHAMFNETFLTEARVPDSAIIGKRNGGWAVANATLMHERAGLGAGGGSAAGGAASPGTLAGHLDRRAGDFTSARKAGSTEKRTRRSSADLLTGLARGNGSISDPVVRQRLAVLHTMGELGRYNAERLKATRASGGDIPGMGNIAKLSMSNMIRLQRDLGLQIVGAQGMLHAYEPEQQPALDAATGNPFLPAVTMTALYAQGPPIYGGTDQIQRNIIGERVLGLPKEPGNDKTVPFSELPKNG